MQQRESAGQKGTVFEASGAQNCRAPAPCSLPVPCRRHLDRIDQRELPLDGKLNANASGTGVNVYILSSGIQSTHDEFKYSDGTPGSRVQAAWGYMGLDVSWAERFERAAAGRVVAGNNRRLQARPPLPRMRRICCCLARTALRVCCGGFLPPCTSC